MVRVSVFLDSGCDAPSELGMPTSLESCDNGLVQELTSTISGHSMRLIFKPLQKTKSCFPASLSFPWTIEQYPQLTSDCEPLTWWQHSGTG